VINRTISEEKERTVRVFFALWPNHVIQKQFAHLAKTLEPVCGGRIVKTQNIHLTLAFLGNVNVNRLPELQSAAHNVTTEAFSLSIQKTHYWKRNHIITAQAEQFPAELFSLVNALRNALSAAGFGFDQHAYKPHITLIRNAKCDTAVDSIKPIEWRAKEWCLIQSKQTKNGVDYIPLKRWLLK
jgi:RNA 2',3'-cyclic 3'-phosphodiesterase